MTTDVAASRPAPSLGRGWRQHVTLCVFSLVMLYPLLWMAGSSFKDNTEILTDLSPVPHSFLLEAYRRGWSGLEVSFGQFQWNSLVIAVLSVLGNVLSCSVTAYAFARLSFPGRRIWFALMLVTLMVPYQATLIPQYLLFRELDWINTILPLVVPKFLAVDAFFVFLMVQFFRGIPRALDEAAVLDGCGPWRIFVSIVLPLSVPVLATAAVFTFIWIWDDFFGPLIYLNDIHTYTAQVGLRSFVDSGGQSDWAALFAMSTLNLLPVFILFLLFQRLLIAGIATSGLKG